MVGGMTVFIYALKDPRDKAVRYIGKTINLMERLRGHLIEKRESHKMRWLSQLTELGLKPEMEIIEIILNSDDRDWQHRESFWIKRFGEIGCELTNLDSGGRNGCRRSEETKRKCSLAKMGYVLPPVSLEKMRQSQIKRLSDPKVREAISRSLTGIKQSQETKDKRAVHFIGRVCSEETRGKIRASNLGQKRSAETKAKIRVARSKQIITPEHRANLSRTIKGRKPSPQTIAASVARCKGVPLTEEFKAKLSAAAKRRWDRVRELKRGHSCPP